MDSEKVEEIYNELSNTEGWNVENDRIVYKENNNSCYLESEDDAIKLFFGNDLTPIQEAKIGELTRKADMMEGVTAEGSSIFYDLEEQDYPSKLHAERLTVLNQMVDDAIERQSIPAIESFGRYREQLLNIERLKHSR